MAMALLARTHFLRIQDADGDCDMLPPCETSAPIVCSRWTLDSASDAPTVSFRHRHTTKDGVTSEGASIHGSLPWIRLAHRRSLESISLEVASGAQMLNVYGRDGKMAGKIQLQTSRASATLICINVKALAKGSDLPLLTCSVSRSLLSSIPYLPITPPHYTNPFVAEKVLLKHGPHLHYYDAEKTRVQMEDYNPVCGGKRKLEHLKNDEHHIHCEVKKAKRNNDKIQRELGRHITSLEVEIGNLKEKMVQQTNELKACRDQVLELKGNIRVFCRCRPSTPNEERAENASVVEFSPLHNHELQVHTHGGDRKTFKFDHIFTPSHSQEEVFCETAPLIVSVLDGFNVCIFAYGQTGTGKTFTMEGSEGKRGVNYRTLERLFQLAAQREGQCTYEISISVLEVYNEEIHDLLTSSPSLGHNYKKLEIKQVAEGMHHVPGAVEAPIHSIEEAWNVLQTGSSARTVGSTNVNKHSSRSHCLVCVMVKGENLLTGECTKSKLWLIDLAGSERIGKTDANGEQLKEAQNINKSLSSLGDVIHALAKKSSHVPYRNSKITRLLQDSLGGQSKTLMFVQISPSEQDVSETLCSLNFASRVRGIGLGAARKQLDPIELLKYKNLVEKAREDGLKKDAIIVELQAAAKVKEQTCKALSAKVKENEGLLSIEKKARSTAEEKLKEQQALIDKQRLIIEKLSTELRAKQRGLRQVPPMDQKLLTLLTPRRPPLQERLTDNREQTAIQQTRKRAAGTYIQKENVCNESEVGTLLVRNHARRVSLSTMQCQGPSTPAAIPLSKSRVVLHEDPTEQLLNPRRRGRASLCVLPQREFPSPWAAIAPPSTVKFPEPRTRMSMACPVDPASLKVGDSMQATASCRSSIAAPQRIPFKTPLFVQPGGTSGGESIARRVSNIDNVNVARGKPPQHPHQAVNRELEYHPKRLIGQNIDEVGRPVNKMRRLSAAMPPPSDSSLCSWALPPVPSTPSSAAPTLLAGGSQPYVTHQQRRTSIGRLSTTPSLQWGAGVVPSTPVRQHMLIGVAQRVPVSNKKAVVTRNLR